MSASEWPKLKRRLSRFRTMAQPLRDTDGSVVEAAIGNQRLPVQHYPTKRGNAIAKLAAILRDVDVVMLRENRRAERKRLDRLLWELSGVRLAQVGSLRLGDFAPDHAAESDDLDHDPVMAWARLNRFVSLLAKETDAISQTRPPRPSSRISAMPHPDRREWTVPEAADYAGIKPKTLYNRISEHKAENDGKFPRYCILPKGGGGRPRINREIFKKMCREDAIARGRV